MITTAILLIVFRKVLTRLNITIALLVVQIGLMVYFANRFVAALPYATAAVYALGVIIVLSIIKKD